jgi:hypothetical protein
MRRRKKTSYGEEQRIKVIWDPWEEKMYLKSSSFIFPKQTFVLGLNMRRNWGRGGEVFKSYFY